MMDTGPAFPLFFFIFHFFCAVSTLIFRENCMSTGFARIMPSLVSNTTNYRFPPFLCFPSFPLSLLPFPFPFFSRIAIPPTLYDRSRVTSSRFTYLPISRSLSHCFTSPVLRGTAVFSTQPAFHPALTILLIVLHSTFAVIFSIPVTLLPCSLLAAVFFVTYLHLELYT